jgi:hypothetical protein
VKLAPDQVLFRFVWPWRVFSAIPATVVEHKPARTVLWIAPGTPVRWPRGERVAVSEVRAGGWAHEEALWYGNRPRPGLALEGRGPPGQAVEIGLFTQEKADAVRLEGERAIERIEAWRPPFSEEWEEWRADEAWPLPQIPAGWDETASS